MDERIDREVPGFVRWLVRPLAHGMRASRQAADARKGASGEQAGNLALRWVLPREWILIPDVVLPVGDGMWTQLDHVAVGPTGVWVIETKAWRGVIRGERDQWRRIEGRSWRRLESPTRQNAHHVRVMEAWLARSLPEARVPVHGAVLFTDADRLTVRDCSQPVFQGALPMAVHLRTAKTEQPVPEGVREAIAQRICTSPELPRESSGPGRP